MFITGQNGEIISEELRSKNILGVWTIFEKHNPNKCTCSYCKDPEYGMTKRFGFTSPLKFFDGWKLIYWKWKGIRFYLRFW